MERALATIRRISELRPILDADLIELAIIDGWQVVVKKGEYSVGMLVVYCEIDSWIPHSIAPFLTKAGHFPKEYEGVQGERLRTVKLRGEVSQGLVLPMAGFDAYFTGASDLFPEGTDVTSFLGILKWEKPLSAQLQGQARGYFPSFIYKTDQERIQNIFHKITDEQKAHEYEVTLKMDGSSMTIYHKNGEVGVCSRNLELKINEENASNSFIKMFYHLGIEEKLHELGKNIAIQGELWGEGINGNWEGVNYHSFHVFDVFDIDSQSYLSLKERAEIVDKLGLDHVELVDVITLEQFSSVDDYLAYADRPSLLNKIAEGVVFKSIQDPNFSFKVINNKFLLKGGD